jgi:hypothetical protein
MIATDASVEPAKLDEGIRHGVRDLGERWATPTAAAESFLLLPAGTVRSHPVGPTPVHCP